MDDFAHERNVSAPPASVNSFRWKHEAMRFGVVLYNDEFKNQTAFITGERCSPRSRHLAGVLDRTEVKGFVMPGDFKVLASIIGEHSVKTVRNSTSREREEEISEGDDLPSLPFLHPPPDPDPGYYLFPLPPSRTRVSGWVVMTPFRSSLVILKQLLPPVALNGWNTTILEIGNETSMRGYLSAQHSHHVGACLYLAIDQQYNSESV
ncbi:hypothetical protein PHLCEN_2v5296 [Hermanssonia centrifuga]|uniref:Uncharacterized protein n=1 Tax=Hermanssonia centrifuga TaxID=98765 RepID=A0A2R6P8J3_9APHY|nr:hypothetical protein PHLCEN_2v5296 [Hermanssonia centrifuga]